MPRSFVQANDDRKVNARFPRDYLPINFEMRRGHQKGAVQQHCNERWNNNVPGHSRETEQGSDSTGPINNEGEGFRSSGEKILGVDWRFNLVILVDIPKHVDHKGRVPRKRFGNRAQKVFLMMGDLLLLMKCLG